MIVGGGVGHVYTSKYLYQSVYLSICMSTCLSETQVCVILRSGRRIYPFRTLCTLARVDLSKLRIFGGQVNILELIVFGSCVSLGISVNRTPFPSSPPNHPLLMTAALKELTLKAALHWVETFTPQIVCVRYPFRSYISPPLFAPLLPLTRQKLTVAIAVGWR